MIWIKILFLFESDSITGEFNVAEISGWSQNNPCVHAGDKTDCSNAISESKRSGFVIKSIAPSSFVN